MGWQFAGCFARADPSVLEAALGTWPQCRGRLIADPFPGIGVAVSDRALTYGDADAEHERAQELAWALEGALVAWSHRFPLTPFVFLRADCSGGVCWYEGYVCQDGAVREAAADRARGGDALRQLVRALGVELEDPPLFAPFTRGFFNRAP
jgi:hypothetical protein